MWYLLHTVLRKTPDYTCSHSTQPPLYHRCSVLEWLKPKSSFRSVRGQTQHWNTRKSHCHQESNLHWFLMLLFIAWNLPNFAVPNCPRALLEKLESFSWLHCRTNKNRNVYIQQPGKHTDSLNKHTFSAHNIEGLFYTLSIQENQGCPLVPREFKSGRNTEEEAPNLPR